MDRQAKRSSQWNSAARSGRVAAVASATAVVLVLAAGGVALAYFTSDGSGAGSVDVGTSSTLVIRQTNDVMYDSTVSPLPGSFPSEAFQATQTSEFGNEINLVHPSQLGSVTVTMESWTCGNWTSGATPCTTTPGTGYTLPITLTLYNAGPTGAVGTVIETTTQTFTIPYRPSADPGTCNHSTGTTGWLDNAATASAYGVTPDTTCHYGLAHNITFHITDHKVLPGTVVYGISFNTQSYGPSPVRAATPQTSLNMALTTSTANPSVGSDVYPGEVDLDSATAGQYCDDGSGGTGTFRLDSPGTPCWTVNGSGAPYWVPAVKFTAASTASQDLYPGGPAQPIDFTVTNPGSGVQHLGKVHITPSVAASGCSVSWFTVTPTVTANETLQPGQTVAFNTEASVTMSTSGGTQDTCKNATVTLAFAST